MRMAIPIYGEFISNAFDFSRRLLLIDLEEGDIVGRSEFVSDDRLQSQRAIWLKELGVDILLCGAISQELAMMVLSQGIEVLPFVTGKIDKVLDDYVAGRLSDLGLGMPGCRLSVGTNNGFGRCRNGRRWQHGHRRQ